MVLSTKSWHFWLYNQFFSTRWRMPSNFCPYFWKIMLSIIIFIPAIVICIPFWIITPFVDEKPSRIGTDFGAGFATSAIGFVIVHMIGMFFSHNKTVFAIGIFGWIIVGAFLIGGLVSYLADNVKFSDTFVGKFVTAKKNKYCPMIDWEEKQEDATEVL